MNKYKRNQRIAGLMHILTKSPNQIISYNYFSKLFNIKKPSISGDIKIIKDLVKKLDIGTIETIPGNSGGVKFSPKNRQKDVEKLIGDLCIELGRPERIIPGGFIYMMDILYKPSIVKEIGTIFANEFNNYSIDAVVTIETKGIPIALMTAEILNVPLVIIRKNIKITEGPTVNINYISGSTRKIQTMSLSKKALKENSKVLVIDDFMKAGGTVKGTIEMMAEFKAEVIGVGVFLSTKKPEKKLVNDYLSLITVERIDENERKIFLEPNISHLHQLK